MKYLETLHSSPHPDFLNISEETLRQYIEDEFELDIDNLNTIKDILNYLSHLIYSTNVDEDVYNPYPNLEWQIPSGFNILNYAVTIHEKMRRLSAVPIKFSNRHQVTDASKQLKRSEQYVKDMINFSFASVVYRTDKQKMESIFDALLANPMDMVKDTFIEDAENKKLFVIKDFEIPVRVGYLYIDSSFSMLNNVILLEIIVGYIFNLEDDVNLVIYSVKDNGIILLGVANNAEEAEAILNNIYYSPGYITIDEVLKHSETHEYTCTFITDGEDFETLRFLDSTRKFNLITLSENGKIVNLK